MYAEGDVDLHLQNDEALAHLKTELPNIVYLLTSGGYKDSQKSKAKVMTAKT